MKNKKLLKFLQPFLCSYNLNSLNLDNPSDRKLIIRHILNYGNEKAVKRLLKNFSLEGIKKVLKTPVRGFWRPLSLNYWLKITGVKLRKDIYEKAIQIYPTEENFDESISYRSKRH
jgi:hypothetical protein